MVAAEPITAPAERELALTIYRQGAAVVQDRRTLFFPTEAYRLEWPGVAPRLQRDTVRFGAGKRALHGYRLRHQPVAMQALLDAYVGRAVSVMQADSRGPAQTDAMLVSADPPLVSVEGEVRIVEPADLVFPEGVPAHLGAIPTLELEIGRVPAPGTATGADSVMLSYLSDGFTWSADYVATIDPTGDRLGLVARATIENRSGMDVADAAVDLVAGQLNVPRERQVPRTRTESSAVQAMDSAKSEPLGDLHRFELNESVSVVNGARYSRRLFVRHGIPLERRYVVAASSPVGREADTGWNTVPVMTELEWTSERGPLPAGTVRVYRQDTDGAVRFVGGERIMDRPQGQSVRITPGRPFSITARRRQTEFERIESRIHAVGHAIEVRNGGSAPVSLRIEEPMVGEWRITRANHPWDRANARLAIWRLDLAPGETRELRYRARIER
ncbi:MAG: DUF4139 domain-containing protein [Halofilum sp. (in: g-proteobacteria)]